MKRKNWRAPGWCLLLWCLQATAATLPDRAMQIYDQVQEMRDEADKRVDPAHPDQRQLREAEAVLRQALQVLEKPESRSLGEGNVYLASRRSNVNMDLAGVLALQGRKQEALDALDAMLGDAWYGDLAKYFGDNPALASLRDEPRFKAVLATLRANNRLWADPALAVPAGSMPDQAHRIAGLSLYWSQAKYNFVYFDHVPGLDWDQTYLDFLPQVIAARTLHDYYDALMRFAPLLHDSHTHVLPPESIANEFFARPALATALVGDQVLVTRVYSPRVAAAGVQVGDEVVSIDGKAVRAYAAERVAPYVSSSTAQDRDVRLYGYQLLLGDHARSVTLGLRDVAGRLHSTVLSRENDPEARRPPPFAWRLVDGDIAYVSLGDFADKNVSTAFEAAWPQISKAKGLILDVRENGGGSTDVGVKILSFLTAAPIPRAWQTTRVYSSAAFARGDRWMQWEPMPDTRKPFVVKRPTHFEGPVAVLIGPRTFSAAEDFTMMFDAMKRGVLVGEATGGSTGNPLIFDLPGGGKGWVCAKRDSYPDGRAFVGKGIAPDIAVAPTVADIRGGRDPVLQRAVAALRRAGKP